MSRPDPASSQAPSVAPAEPFGWRRGAIGLTAVALLCALFIGSYVGALHRPEFRDVQIAAQGPAAAGLASVPGLRVVKVSSPQEAQRAIDERRAYGSVTSSASGALVLTIAPAASPAIAQELSLKLRPALAKQTGTQVQLRQTHPLTADDPRGLVGFYLAIGWVVAGYLGATVLALAFGPGPTPRRTLARIGGVAALGVVMGVVGAVIASSVGSITDGTLGIIAIGALTTLAVGTATIALQSIFGMLGTGAAILIFVIAGNPSAGGAAAPELMPQPWQAIGQLLPNGASNAAVRDLAYFPDASLASSLIVLFVWTIAAAALALLVGDRGRGLTESEAEASLAGVG